MINYQSLPLLTWQQYGQDACNSIIIHVKEQAQLFFFNFVQDPKYKVLFQLIQQGSDILVFVIFSYLKKNPLAFSSQIGPFSQLYRLLSSWHLNQFNFTRPNKPTFPQYVSRTIFDCLGSIMKVLYQQQTTQQRLMVFLQNLPGSFLKLILFKLFIDAVQVIDYQMGYIKYRALVYNFQDTVIPLACDILLPYFYKVQQNVKIQQLSGMQASLNLQSQSNIVNVNITKQQQIEASYVFSVLKKIVQYNYNITYTQYESQQVIDTCLISFPEKVLEKMINPQFIQSVLYLIQKVAMTKFGQKRRDHLNLGLDCLAKMMQARLGYILQKKKQVYIITAMKGLRKMMQICQNINDQFLLEGILNCNKRLLMNAQLSYLRSAISNNPEIATMNHYQQYLNDLTYIITVIIQGSNINVDNGLLAQALQLANKLAISMGQKRQMNIDDDFIFFKQFLQTNIANYLGNLFNNTSILPHTRYISISQDKTTINNCFQQFKKFASFSYKFLFQKVNQHLDHYANYRKQNYCTFANILFLLSQLMDHCFLQRSLYCSRANEQQIYMLCQAIKKSTFLISQYMIARKKFTPKDSQYLQLAIILFCDNIIIEFMNSFDTTINGKIKIKQKLFQVMIGNESQYQNLSQPTLINYMGIIFQFFKVKLIGGEDQMKMSYSLNIIQKCVFKLKWNMKRQAFLQTQIYQHLSSYFQQLFLDYRSTNVGDMKAKIAKMLVSLTFDDIHDNYRNKINNFIKILQSHNCVSLILYDMIGVFQGIENFTVAKYLSTVMLREMDIKNLFIKFYEFALKHASSLFFKDICRVCKCIILNKGIKNQNCPIHYQFLKCMLPALNLILNKMLQRQLNIDFWQQSILQLIQLIYGILDSHYVNIYIVDNATTIIVNSQPYSMCKQFIQKILKIFYYSMELMHFYPLYQQKLLGLFIIINRQILDFIYSSQSLSNIYNKLIKTLMINISFNIQKIMAGNKQLEDRLIKMLQLFKNYLTFFNKKSKLTHKQILLSNLKQFYNQVTQPNYDSVMEKICNKVLSLALSPLKSNISILRTCSRLVCQIAKNFKRQLQNGIMRLNFGNDCVQRIIKIVDTQRSWNEDLAIQQLKTWFKQYGYSR